VSEYVYKSHNITVLICHLVFPAKYRRAVFDEDVDTVMKEVCIEIENRYQMKFLEIGTDKDHVHFLVQSVPSYSLTKIVSTIKSLTGTGDLQAMSGRQKEALGRGILDGRVFCKYGRQAWQREYDSQIRQTARKRLS
jgi:putative transposase